MLIYLNNFYKNFKKLEMNSSIKKIAISILILLIIAIAFVIILSIWNILTPDMLWRSISTLGTIAVASLVVIIITKLTTENKEEGEKK